MDLKNMATQLLMEKMGGNADAGTASSALDDLLGGGGGFDLGRVVSQFTGEGGELAHKAQSWLGDGANEAISVDQIKQVIGSDKISAFAQKLGVDADTAGASLSQFLPEVIDKSSSGGNLLDSVGGVGGLRGLASRFFK